MIRAGTFSSSQIWKLMTNDRSKKPFGTQGWKYIKQVRYELELGRAIQPERDARQTNWGKFVQHRVFDLLPSKYTMIEGEKRFYHPSIRNWSGVPDTTVYSEGVVGDIKCPFNLEVFADKVNALQDLNTYKEMFDDDYWQHISNAILLRENGHSITHFEAIIYVPYLSELMEIRESANEYNGNQNHVAFINWAQDDELPYLIEGRKYKNLNIVRHPILEEDVKLLIERVELANTYLNVDTSIESPKQGIAGIVQ